MIYIGSLSSNSHAYGLMAEVWAAFLVILFLYVLNKFLPIIAKKRILPPGPVGLPIIGHFHLLGKNPQHDLNRLAQKHGPVMYLRLGLIPAVVISSPAGAELVLKTHDLIFANRPHVEAAQYISYEQRNVVFGRYGFQWRNLRKLCTLELLSQHRINQFQSNRIAELGALVASLKLASRKHETVDVTASISALTENVIYYMVCGKNYEEKDTDATRFKVVVKEALQVAAVFNLGDYFPFLGVLDLQGLTRRMKHVSKILDAFLEKIIDDHVKNELGKNHGRRDFVDIMMGMLETGEAGFEFDRRHLKAVMFDIFVAGMDISATAVEWTLSELLKHPNVMQNLQKELSEVVGLDNMVEESHLERLPYLDCVIKETLRLHPVAPLLLPHESMEDCEIEGFHIPKKSRLIVNIWAIGRDPSVWHEPDKFLPDRFIGSNIDLRGHDFQLIPFGSGRRGCPGLQLGLLLVRLMVAQLMHCFDWELPNGMKPNDLDMSEQSGLVTARAKHLMAIPTFRLHC